jgi:hypothetical protein
MIALPPRTCWVLSAVLLILTFPLSRLAGAQVPKIQSRETNQRTLPNSVTLGGGTHAETMARLRVVRQYTLDTIRANPHVTLGEQPLDFTPMLTNPKALPNLALRLQALPQHVQVQENTTDLTEVAQGLVIHHVLSYQVLPGKCADASARAQLAQAGVACFSEETASQRVAEFGMPGSPRYVVDPQKRQAAIAAYQRNSAAENADAATQIANLRKALADPAQRAQIAAKVGQAEAARLSTLSDDQLKNEVINSAVQRVEQTMFVPNQQSANFAHPLEGLKAAPDAGEMTAGKQLLNAAGGASSAPNYPRLLKIVPPAQYHTTNNSSQPGGDQTTDIDLGTYVYLTGFTLGHDYEWSQNVSVTINWCVVGCSSTYSIGVYAGFNYGFGLRFPIQTELSYHNVTHANNTAQASLKADFAPINGTDADFQSTGIDPTQLFDGKELVAQVGADAGFNYNLPVVGSGGTGFSVGVDFTDMLPSPYTGGHFLPPAPGQHGIDTPFIFNQVDLLGGLLDFGVLGGQVFPAVNINLHSNKLDFTVDDLVAKRNTQMTATGQTVNVSTDPSKNNDSHFRFGNPVYNLGFTLTPGIDAHLYVDVAVWSQSWDWPVWFPQLAVNLPPNGIDFGCHAGTTCAIEFEPEHQAGMEGGLLSKLQSEGCTKQGSAMNCTKLQGYDDCLNIVSAHTLLGVQSCNPGMVLKEEDTADRELTGAGCAKCNPAQMCQRNNGRIGEYLCPLQGNMMDLCQLTLKNGAILSCGVLVPTSADQILKRGNCSENGETGAYACPSGMMGLCQLYVKNHVVASCEQER